MKSYAGNSMNSTNAKQVMVFDDDNTYPLNPRYDLANHSPDGFNWGYGGSGPMQLALALLADATGDDKYALDNYRRFGHNVISQIKRPFVMPVEQVILLSRGYNFEVDGYVENQQVLFRYIDLDKIDNPKFTTMFTEWLGDTAERPLIPNIPNAVFVNSVLEFLAETSLPDNQ